MHRRRFIQGAAFAPLLLSLPEGRDAISDGAAMIHRPNAEFMATLPRLMEVAMLPGVGIGVVSGHRLVWSHYAGVADATAATPIDARSLFPGCSLGKPLFAQAVLRLVDEGRLDLDRPLAAFLPTDAPTGKFGSKVTARHVLSHSTGFVNWRQGTNEQLTSEFEPGTRFQYSGEGFYTLQRCVEKITGTGFEQFIQDHLMVPLGMRSSTYLWRSDAELRVVSGHTAARQPNRRFWDFNKRLFELIAKSGEPLARWNHERIVRAMTGPDIPMPNGISPNVAFSLLTTVSDYALLAARLAAPAGDALDLKPATRMRMTRPVSRINSALSWGLGIGLEMTARGQYLWQWGDNGLWKDFLLVHPGSGSAVVVFTNGANGMRVAERIVRAASGLEHEVFLWA